MKCGCATSTTPAMLITVDRPCTQPNSSLYSRNARMDTMAGDVKRMTLALAIAKCCSAR